MKILVMNKTGLIKKLFISLFYIILFIIFNSCTTKKGIKEVTPISQGKEPLKGTINKQKFQREGFITRDIYRVVIVQPNIGNKYNMKSLIKIAKRKTYTSLQNYLLENDIRINRNTQVRIINLINANGKLIKIDMGRKSSDTYIYEITKKNLKQHIKNLSKNK